MKIQEKEMDIPETIGIALAVGLLGFVFGLGYNAADFIFWRLIGAAG